MTWFWSPESPDEYFVVVGPDGAEVVLADDLGPQDEGCLVSGPFNRDDANEARHQILQEVSV